MAQQIYSQVTDPQAQLTRAYTSKQVNLSELGYTPATSQRSANQNHPESERLWMLFAPGE